jgi:hypothetical protein
MNVDAGSAADSASQAGERWLLRGVEGEDVVVSLAELVKLLQDGTLGLTAPVRRASDDAWREAGEVVEIRRALGLAIPAHGPVSFPIPRSATALDKENNILVDQLRRINRRLEWIVVILIGALLLFAVHPDYAVIFWVGYAVVRFAIMKIWQDYCRKNFN